MLPHRCPKCLRRPSLDAVIELLALLLPILASADPPLAAHVDSSGVPPFFALSLFITWFAHNLQRLGQAARLFDLFIASHPLMPLYAAVAVLVVTNPPAVLPACACVHCKVTQQCV